MNKFRVYPPEVKTSYEKMLFRQREYQRNLSERRKNGELKNTDNQFLQTVRLESAFQMRMNAHFVTRDRYLTKGSPAHKRAEENGGYIGVLSI